LGFPFPAAASVRWFGFGGEAAAEVASWPKRESAGGKLPGESGLLVLFSKTTGKFRLYSLSKCCLGGWWKGDVFDIPLPIL